MQKKAFFIHGWGGAPEEGWRPWLGKELEKRGFVVANLLMPNSQNPVQAEWVEAISSAVGEPDENCYLVGHSLGVIAILRYLESLQDKSKVGGVILVAGFTNDLNIPELNNFFSTPINWAKIKHSGLKFVSIESDNDPYDLARYNEDFAKYLGAKTILAHNMKHFSVKDGIKEVPLILDEILSLS